MVFIDAALLAQHDMALHEHPLLDSKDQNLKPCLRTQRKQSDLHPGRGQDPRTGRALAPAQRPHRRRSEQGRARRTQKTGDRDKCTSLQIDTPRGGLARDARALSGHASGWPWTGSVARSAKPSIRPPPGLHLDRRRSTQPVAAPTKGIEEGNPHAHARLEYLSRPGPGRGRRGQQAQPRYGARLHGAGRRGCQDRPPGRQDARADRPGRRRLAKCDGCITVHAEAARKLGATKEEIAEALGVAIAIGAGAALVYSTRALDAFTAAREAALA